MLALRTKHKRWLIFIIIILSAYTGYRLSNFEPTAKPTPEVDLREARNIFDRANNYRKTVINFKVDELSKADSTFQVVLNSDGVSTKYYYNRGNNIVAILEIEPQISQETEAILRSIPGFDNEKTTVSPGRRSERYIDVDSHIEQNEMILTRLQERRNNPHLTTREIAELQGQMRTIQTAIDSLSSIQSIEEERSNNLIFATINRTPSPMAGGTFSQYRNLIVWTAGSLVGYTLIAILAFFCYELLNRLMNLIGIKSAKSDASYGGYKYGGGSYGYGYKRKPKKKKIYVKKKSSDNDNDQEEKTDILSK